MHDSPYLPPRDGDGNLAWDPNGPYGKLVDLASPEGLTIGDLVQSETPPLHGWMPVGDGIVAPWPPPPGTQPPPSAYADREAADDTAAVLLLLLSG